MIQDLLNHTIVITGASMGIGAATALECTARGANVALLARSSSKIEGLAAQIGSKAMALPLNVADAAAFFQAIDTVTERFGPIDALINNAGVIEPIAHLVDADPTAWSEAIDINLKGVFYGMRAVIPQMRARGKGTIITVSSGAAHSPLEGWSAYCSAKAGAAMLTRAAHLEESPYGLRIMGLSPGTVATQMQVKIRASGINPVSTLAPSDHRPASAPARVLAWMCTPAADAYLGQELALNDAHIRQLADFDSK